MDASKYHLGDGEIGDLQSPRARRDLALGLGEGFKLLSGTAQAEPEYTHQYAK